ncbi:hypothetical protein [Marisediminicola sp. LYQ134]|uniref:hypothetical protein n=1 Tax=Marisediminicola sp. LYQ134 TaxID=3391061 RepID=UPI00398348D1
MQITRWQPPWPPLQISECEWVIIRDSQRQPAAIIRRFEFGEHREVWWRIGRWAPRSEDRELIGWVRTLELADMAVKFSPKTTVDLQQFSPARTAEEWTRYQEDRPRYLGS